MRALECILNLASELLSSEHKATSAVGFVLACMMLLSMVVLALVWTVIFGGPQVEHDTDPANWK